MKVPLLVLIPEEVPCLGLHGMGIVNMRGREISELDTIRVPPHPVEAVIPMESDANALGKNLTVSQALAHAAHHIVSEQYLAELVSKDEAEPEAIDRELDANPETPDWGSPSPTLSGHSSIAVSSRPARKTTRDTSQELLVAPGVTRRRRPLPAAPQNTAISGNIAPPSACGRGPRRLLARTAIRS
ncbi:hypothetical protein B0H14DRAFT_3889110 [Mycena olivaceomarginata]|nr:hypothetical protein B0H14DRAFT_3889110 [Mycena olivaceomarginata]